MRIIRAVGLYLVCGVALAACDPLDSLQNQDYRAFVENAQTWEIGDAVAAFNHLDSKRGEFNCKAEFEAAKRAIWREQAAKAPIEFAKLAEGKAISKCLDDFQASSGVGDGKLRRAVVSQWSEANFMPDIQKRIDAEVSTSQKRLDSAACAGDDCLALTVIGDIAVVRAGMEVAAAWNDAHRQCRNANYGGLDGWRLPTKAELVAMRESNKLPSDVDRATYWSGSREFDDTGNLRAWVLRFDLESRSEEDVAPALVSFEKDGRVGLAKVRCVTDLSKAKVAPTEVDTMEAAIAKAGCPRGEWDRRGYGWDYYVRIREGKLVTFQPQAKTGNALKAHCKGLNFCKLTWRAPGRTGAKLVAADAWLQVTPAEGEEEPPPNGRCVAEIPEPE